MGKKHTAPKPDNAPRLVGYARVSTEDQSLNLQLDALRAAGVMDDNLHQEKISGAAKNRKALDYAIMDLRPGDTLVVWRIDRLARSMRDLYRRLDEVYSAGANFRSLTEQFDFGTVAGKFVLGILGLVAELERQLTIQRTKAGIEAWRVRGGSPGRKITFDAAKQAKAKALLKSGMTIRAVAAKLKVSPSLLYQRGFRRTKYKRVK